MKEGAPFNAAYEQFMLDHQIEKKLGLESSVSSIDEMQLPDFFGPGGYQVCSFENPQMLDRQGLNDRVASASYMPLPGQPEHGPMQDKLEEMFDQHKQNGFVRIPLKTLVYFGRIT